MRLFKTNSSKLLTVSGHRLWVLVLLITLILLATLSRSNFGDNFTGSGFKSQASARVPSKGTGYPPVLAYWICGSNGDGKRILRLLKAIYHPRNQYLLQLDAGSSEIERAELAFSVESESVFKAFGNVDVVGQSYPLDKTGASALSAVLHAAALLLKIGSDWDWFIPLSASDYPLMSQDDLLHAFTFLPRDLNFIDYTTNTGWKERLKVNQIVIDPNLYYRETTPLMYAVETRTTPDAFKIFGGSPWTILTRPFMEHCVHGWDNFPRKLLMFLTNIAFPLESYFHTVICNSLEFQNTTVNNDLRFMIWDNPTLTGEPQILKLSEYDKMLTSGAAFARQFEEGDPVLEKIDQNVLNRSANGVVPGKWCSSGPGKNNTNLEEVCSTWGSNVNIDAVKPRSHGMKLRALLSKLATNGSIGTSQCLQQ
ncbi:beta-glucuronosyltransferase GlcAT14A-like [Pistacia vera]|uniref:beta-glucuronosyltransferase GlcAT14A-like n=1 Tax=Pistacia vera TaxID=55513 RepID=UPI001263274E|nr:beta-glucuronosyltransferase GlcAT14A-like [Pistacia vera]